MFHLLKHFLVGFYLFIFVNSKILNKLVSFKIIPLSPCKAQLNDGRLIDLTSLDNPANPRVAEESGFRYKFNPCSPISCESGQRASAAICQETSDGQLKYNCGDQSSVSFSQESDIFTMRFTAPSRQSTIKCVCSKIESFRGGENPQISSQYEFTFNSPCCCPDGCSFSSSTPVLTTENPQNNNDLSLGSILIIIFGSFLIVYFVGGFLFLKFHQKKNGTEMIPNYEFWGSVPGNIKAGVSFTVSKARGQAYQNF